MTTWEVVCLFRLIAWALGTVVIANFIEPNPSSSILGAGAFISGGVLSGIISVILWAVYRDWE